MSLLATQSNIIKHDIPALLNHIEGWVYFDGTVYKQLEPLRQAIDNCPIEGLRMSRIFPKMYPNQHDNTQVPIMYISDARVVTTIYKSPLRMVLYSTKDCCVAFPDSTLPEDDSHVCDWCDMRPECWDCLSEDMRGTKTLCNNEGFHFKENNIFRK